MLLGTSPSHELSHLPTAHITQAQGYKLQPRGASWPNTSMSAPVRTKEDGNVLVDWGTARMAEREMKKQGFQEPGFGRIRAKDKFILGICLSRVYADICDV